MSANNLCGIDWIWCIYRYSNIPKIGDDIDFLAWIWENDFLYGVFLSKEKVWEWEYKLISWNISTWNFAICQLNTSKEEVKIRKNYIGSYLLELHTKKPRTAKKLLTTLENLNLYTYNQETNILVLYAKEILKMLVDKL
jgi:hypothetical protein